MDKKINYFNKKTTYLLQSQVHFNFDKKFFTNHILN